MRDRLVNLVGALAARIGDRVEDIGQASMGEGVAAPASALTTIQLHPGITIRWLSHALTLSHPGTVRLVDRLVAAGLIEKRSSEDDGRAVSLWLTKEGNAVSQAVLDRRNQSLNTILKCLTDGERSQLERIADKILKSSYVDEALAVRTCRWCDGEACTDCPIDAAMEA